MSKEMLHGLIELIPDANTEEIYRVLVKFIPEDTPLPDELKAIAEAKEDIAENGTVKHNDIDWN